jgi:hypothetical protein
MRKSQILIWNIALFASTVLLSLFSLINSGVNVRTLEEFLGFYIGFSGIAYITTGIVAAIVYISTSDARSSMIWWTILYIVFGVAMVFGIINQH